MGAGSQYTLGEYSGTLYHERNELHRTITPDDKYQIVWIPGNPTGYSKQGFTVVRLAAIPLIAALLLSLSISKLQKAQEQMDRG